MQLTRWLYCLCCTAVLLLFSVKTGVALCFPYHLPLSIEKRTTLTCPIPLDQISLQPLYSSRLINSVNAASASTNPSCLVACYTCTNTHVCAHTHPGQRHPTAHSLRPRLCRSCPTAPVERRSSKCSRQGGLLSCVAVPILPLHLSSYRSTPFHPLPLLCVRHGFDCFELCFALHSAHVAMKLVIKVGGERA
jgi:hypothetical protein